MLINGFNIQTFVCSAVAILIALTFHELAHGYMAFSLGDPTAKMQGRLTLNPLAHLDPIGTILLLIVGFGWAKPVPVNPLNFRGSRKKGMVLVGLAGPLMNIILAIIAALLIKLLYAFYFNGMVSSNSTVFSFFFQTFKLLMSYNIILAVFNLIPIPPLDGSKILAGLLPSDYGRYFYQFERYGSIILMVLIVFGGIRYIILPLAIILGTCICYLTGQAWFADMLFKI